MPAVIRFEVFIVVVVVVVVVILGLDILCCGHRHLSRCAVARRLYRHAAATIVAPMTVSLRLSCASGWLLHRHLSRHASASVAPRPLLWRLTCAGWLSLHQLS